MNGKILIIDDNPMVLKSLANLFKSNNLDTTTALTPAQGLVLLAQDSFDLVIQAMNFGADTKACEQGEALFHQIRDRHPNIAVIFLTTSTDSSNVVNLAKAGAADYLLKPWDDNKLLVSVNNLIDLYRLQRLQDDIHFKRFRRRQALESQFELCGICFDSNEMLQLLEMATQVACSNVPIVISGPNGTEKEKVAEIVQANSGVNTAPFIKVNVATLTENLIAAELFGVDSDGHNGEAKMQMGCFEAASGGTLFLDGIDNLSFEGQGELLQVLQTGEFTRLGSAHSQRLSLRLLSATNVDLAQAVKAGAFRQELYHQLNVIELKLPALEQRKDDVLPLVQLFLEPGYKLASCAKRKLKQYHWPGNVVQLENTIGRAMLLCDDKKIKAANLAIEIDQSRFIGPSQPSQDDVEQALADADGFIANAALRLGLSRQSLIRHMDKLKIERD